MSLIKVKGRGAENLGRRNMIINGAMQVAQRGTSSSNISSSGYYTVDSVDLAMSTTAGRFTQSQVTDAPDGFSHALKFDCTTADTSVAAGENCIVLWQLEGQNVQQMAKGTSSAKQVTVSFYAKANAAKTYVCELKDFTNTRTVSKAFTVGTSYTRHEITFPADTTGAITSDNARQFAMNIWLHAGSTYTSGTLQTTWGTQVSANRCPGIDSFFSSTDNTFFITGVQMEVGSASTDFEHRSFGEELALCQRYYQEVRQGIMGMCGNTNGTCYWWYEFPVQMRASPSISCSTTAYRYGDMISIGVPMSSITVNASGYRSEKTGHWYVTGTKDSGSPVQYRTQLLEPSGASHGNFQFSAEL
tara:strand:+ start:188 stop:1264 length:1077 start_codon:yes stop_codon:yes gene_type:complete